MLMTASTMQLTIGKGSTNLLCGFGKGIHGEQIIWVDNSCTGGLTSAKLVPHPVSLNSVTTHPVSLNSVTIYN